MSDHETEAREEDALGLKAMAAESYTSGDLQSALTHAKRAAELQQPSLEGIPEMISALEILNAATPVYHDDDSRHPDYYRILQVDRFSHINAIKKQYKKLALTLHPDKSSFPASEEAFKLLGEAMQVLSDTVRRNEYDTTLRFAMQSESVNDVGLGTVDTTFSSTCCFCQFMHQFERKFLGQNLMCCKCKKSFTAIEIEGEPKNVGVGETRKSSRIRELVAKNGDVEKRVISSVTKCLKRGVVKKSSVDDALFLKDLMPKRVKRSSETNGVKVDVLAKDRKIELLNEDGNGDEVVESKRAKRMKDSKGDNMTLFQIRKLMKKRKHARKLVEENSTLNDEVNAEEGSIDDEENKCSKGNENGSREAANDEEGSLSTENEVEDEEVEILNTKDGISLSMELEADISTSVRNSDSLQVRNADDIITVKDREIGEKRQLRARRSVSRHGISAIQDLDTQKPVIPQNHTTFHDFNKERRKRCYRKGQVLAMYNDKNGAPWNYALIDEVVSLRPFEATLSLLQFQSIGDNGPAPKGLHFSCGNFTVSHKLSINNLNSISHVMDFERAAKHVYRIYPKKGSVWALHRHPGPSKSYSICVILSSYSDAYRVSLGELEKVTGFNTIFKRQEIGAKGVRCLGKQEVQLFSHQIPAKKLIGEKGLGLPEEDCWELDPQSIPGWGSTS